MLSIFRTNSASPEFVELVALLDADLAVRDGEDHAFFAQFNKIDSIGHVVVAYENDVAIGCGAFKMFEESIVEIKRMYVRPEFRGKGVAGSVLGELEKWARDEGFTAAVLETGFKQPEAVRLYEKSGYERIPNYGQYEGIDGSVCFRKSL